MYCKLCGGLIFALLMEAKIFSSKRENREGKISRTSQPLLMHEIVKITQPDYNGQPASMPKQIVSKFARCELTSSPTYLTFQNQDIAKAFDERVRTHYSDVLLSVEKLCDRYLIPAATQRIGHLFLLLLSEDKDIQAELFVTPDGLPRNKEDILRLEQYYFPALFLGLWHYCVSCQLPNDRGKDTFTKWFEQKDANNVWKLKTDIQEVKTSARIFPASISDDPAIHSPEALPSLDEGVPSVISVPQKLLIDETGDIFHGYIENIAEYYRQIKTLLYQESLVPFYDFYVCNDLWCSSNIIRNIPSHILGPVMFHQHISDNLIHDVNAPLLCRISKNTILSGTGGIGKTMMMRHLLLSAAEEYDGTDEIPVMIPLKEYRRTITLQDFIYSCIQRHTDKVSYDDFQQALSAGRFLLLLDGLDEVSSQEIDFFEQSIGAFVTRYKGNHYVISSRPVSDFISLATFEIFRLQPLTKKQAVTMISKLVFRPDEPSIKEKFVDELKTRLFNTHYSFASNPLLLTIMLMTFEKYGDVPNKMHRFYAKAYEVLSQTHDASKGAYKRAFKTGFDADKFGEYLQEFCAKTYMADEYNIEVDHVKKWYNGLKVRQRYGDSATFSSFIADVCDNLCLMYLENGQYHFMHRSFQEYFTALFFSHQEDAFLWNIAQAFEKKRFQSSTDSTFGMLYDMIPEKIEKHVFIRCLIELVEKCDAGYGYYTFLETVYPEIQYSYGNTGDDTAHNNPSSFLYSFLSEKLHFRHREENELPFYHDFVEERYFRIQEPDDDGEIFDSVVSESSIPSDYNENLFPITEEGCMMKLSIAGLEDFRYCDDESEQHPDDPDSYDNREIRDIVSDLTSVNYPLRIEYEGMKKAFEALKLKHAPKPETIDLFDLF